MFPLGAEKEERELDHWRQEEVKGLEKVGRNRTSCFCQRVISERRGSQLFFGVSAPVSAELENEAV